MAWALITTGFDYRRPGKNVSFSVSAAKVAQPLPHDVVAYAVEKKFGIEVAAPNRQEAPPAAGVEKVRSKRRT